MRGVLFNRGFALPDLLVSEGASSIVMIMMKEAVPQWAQYSPTEKLLLLEELWDDFAHGCAAMPIPDWQRKKLAKRFAEYVKDPEARSSSEEVRNRLTGIE